MEEGDLVMKRLLILMTLLIFTVGCTGGDSEARVIALEGKMEALQAEIEGLRNELQNSNNALREAINASNQEVQQQLQQLIQSKFLEIQKALAQ